MSYRIASKLVGDQLPGCLPLMFQGPTKEAFSRSAISTLGDQDIDRISTLIDGSPQVVALTSNLHEQFINVPNVAEPPLPRAGPTRRLALGVRLTAATPQLETTHDDICDKCKDEEYQ
jgi:hypothetical protein